jgi:hypothetical protein
MLTSIDICGPNHSVGHAATRDLRWSIKEKEELSTSKMLTSEMSTVNFQIADFKMVNFAM